jgi:hypothetical protein
MNYGAIRNLFFVLCSFFSLIQSQNNPYYGKTLSQLKEIDAPLKEVVDQSLNDLKWYNRFYLKAIKSPTKCYISKIKRNILVLNQAIQEIDQCLTEARQELTTLNQKKIGIACNDVNDLVANIALAPWLLLERFQKKRTLVKKENEINSMLATKQELQRIVDSLSNLLDIY